MPSTLATTPDVIDQVCAAVVDALNGAEFSENQAEAREVARFYTVEEALEDLSKQTRVAVFKEATRRKQITRRNKSIEIDVGVAIIRKLAETETAESFGDLAQKLAGEIADLLEDQALDVDLNVRHLDTTVRLIYSPNHLREQRLFLLPATFTFLVYP